MKSMRSITHYKCTPNGRLGYLHKSVANGVWIELGVREGSIIQLVLLLHS